ncbi:DUF6169 family protein [Arcicella aquatica]|uniref:DUF6169 family protein n=1 Tax=Arcicella aquatica TaxID=217141 RepID=A0ABU5QTQ9_9BACT|nr:DUF6169 family protein [Arcicella aquatica]MEA5260502.1 DUF6169 family protein [Arcicella aquatica]
MSSKRYNPYQINILEQTQNGFVFYFKTAHEIEYIASFKKADYYFTEDCHQRFNVYDFTLINQQDLQKTKDFRIKDTIHKMIDYFMKENGHAIVYICDGLDDKAEARHRLFQWWYASFATDEYQAHFRKIEFEGYDNYVGILSLKEDMGFESYVNWLEIVG